MAQNHVVASLSADCLPARKASPAVWPPGPERYPLPAPGEAPPVWKTLEYRRTKQQEWRAKNPDKSIKYVMASYNKRRATPEGWAAQALSCAKRRAKAKGLTSDIAASEIALPTHCSILGLKLVYGSTHNDPCSASFDRIDPGKGYVSGNVRVISRRANMLRSDCTDPDIFLALAADAERLRG